MLFLFPLFNDAGVTSSFDPSSQGPLVPSVIRLDSNNLDNSSVSTKESPLQIQAKMNPDDLPDLAPPDDSTEEDEEEEEVLEENGDCDNDDNDDDEDDYFQEEHCKWWALLSLILGLKVQYELSSYTLVVLFHSILLPVTRC